MKILNLSLDKSILDDNSKTAKRIVEYGDIADKYAIVISVKDSKEIRLSEKVFVYGSGGGNKICQLFNLRKTAKKLLKQGKFDVITVQDQYYLALIGWILARKFRVGLELQIHGFEKYFGLRKIIAKFVIPRANAIRCVSERLKRQLVSEFGVEEEKITAIPIYTEIRNSNIEIRNKFKNKNPNEKFIFLTVGRLAPVKNIGLQIKAMAEAVKNYPNAELWIIGDGQERKKLELEIENCQLQNSVKLLGWKNNPEEFYQQTDAFLLTSDYEGWGMVVVEAAGYGLPIIMTDVGCAGELIENEKSGLVIPVNDQSKLEEAMIRIINDDNLRKKLAEGAFSAVKNLPSKEETLALYKKSWKKAMNNKYMKLLIITQKVDINDPVLGFFHGWLEKLADKADLFVIANYVGEYNLPENVKVFSLGKEKGHWKIVKFLKYRWLLLKLLPKSGGVFYHMCPEYVIGVGLCPKIFRKKTLLWYTHKSVNWKLKLAEKLVDKIFTASRESFRLPSKKVEITGHGIDVDKFSIFNFQFSNKVKNFENDIFKIITAGRIAEVKNLHLLIDAAEILRNKNFSAQGGPAFGWEIKIAGAPILESDKIYFEKLKNLIQEKNLEDIIKFVGPIPNKEIVAFYQEGDLFVNFSDTGSLDKAILEAMASGLRVLTSNEAFKNIVPAENFTAKNAEEISQKIIHLAKNEENNQSREYIFKFHNLEKLIDKITGFYK